MGIGSYQAGDIATGAWQRSDISNAGNVNIASGRPIINVLLNPDGGSILTGSVGFPTNELGDGDIIRIFSTGAIVTLTVNDATIIGTALTAIAVGSNGEYIYDLTGNKWYRF